MTDTAAKNLSQSAGVPATCSTIRPKLFVPPFRELRGYAFDPSLSRQIDTAFLNEIKYKVRWEDLLAPGPVGEYLEVMDYDPSSGQWYAPVDLNAPYLLAQDGLPPSESNPQFHQQMVYAVAMTTIANFENALGRQVFWSPRRLKHTGEHTSQDLERGAVAPSKYEEYVQRLRIYPHAFRGANAYYSPEKKALLFGYFSARPANNTVQMPDSLVFTCLSHDIVAHETAHAILDGVYRHYIEDSNLDVLAFHEAFADIVALFQHFTFPEVLVNQIARTRGDLASENLLGQLAQEFGSATGSYGALRDALGDKDATGKWHPRVPNGNEYQRSTEPHARGSVLVAAIFEAFVTIYKSRTADLLRIASGGTGILPQGQLHPDLVNRLATEASKAARHILSMCIRALDYCPPMDLTFGDFLRGMITADVDLVAEDSRAYRLAVIDAFRQRGIYPQGIKSLSVESLCHATPPLRDLESVKPLIEELTGFLRKFRNEVMDLKSREHIFNTTKAYIGGKGKEIKGLHRQIYENFTGSKDFERLTGLVFNDGWEALGVRTSRASHDKEDEKKTGPSISVQALRLVSRVGPGSAQSNQIIVSLVQRAGAEVLEKNGQLKVVPFVPKEGQALAANKLILYGGVNLIFDLETLELKYAIGKPLLDVVALANNPKDRHLNYQRILEQYRYRQHTTRTAGRFDQHFHTHDGGAVAEPFALLHEH